MTTLPFVPNGVSAATAAGDEPWWQVATGYQIYPASFADSNGDGIGDIPGIIGKLDHLAELGIGFIWLSPVFASPQVDNGYDISDYQAIDPRYGTLADMDRLIAEARSRGIGIVMDLVVNHTSDQHPWFKAARADKHSPYRDFYIWRDQHPAKGEPTDIEASFGGSAWTWDEVAGAWYFHLFAPQQPDLNWTNPALRQAVYAMMRWWLARGIAGFRMDVIDLIAKEPERGIVGSGPQLHTLLQELHRETLAGHDVVTVGEAWSATTATAPLFSAPERHELSMVFQFAHVTRFWDPKGGKWQPLPIDVPALKAILAEWQGALHGQGWNALFWNNHDLPRAVSRYGHDGAFRVASARMLAVVLHGMQGTPYVYQGEEIGMTNAGFTRIDQYRDLETLNFHRERVAAGMSEAAFLTGARANSRDNARTPMQWSAAPHAGFTTGTPWLEVNANYPTVNVAADRADPHGVFAMYQRMIALRRQLRVLRQGTFQLLVPGDPRLFAYERRLGEERLVVVANFTAEPASAGALVPLAGTDLLTDSRFALDAGSVLPAYAAHVIRPD